MTDRTTVERSRSLDDENRGVPEVCGERFAGWLLRGSLSIIIGIVVLYQILTWLPQYLTWPWWVDQDHFAVLALGWDNGLVPYRDYFCYNFPGSIYLHWAIGHLAGWGRPEALYAADASLILAFAGLLLWWGRRSFGTVLPGLISFLAFFWFYAGLSYLGVAQRDVHSAVLSVGSYCVITAGRGWWATVLSALALAAAATFRPHAVLLAPAIIVAVAESVKARGGGGREERRAALAWSALFASAFVLAFLPLVWSRAFVYFVNNLRELSYGSTHNAVTLHSFIRDELDQFTRPRLLIPLLLILVIPPVGCGGSRRSLSVLMAYFIASSFRGLSPNPHYALGHTMTGFWCLMVGMVAGEVVNWGRAATRLAVAFILILIILACPGRKPRFVSLRASAQAIAAFMGRGHSPVPLCYERGAEDNICTGYYPWKDYQGSLAFLRTNLGPRTRIANALLAEPSLTGTLGRLSIFPAESLSCLLVRPNRLGAYREALENGWDSVVVWSPAEKQLDFVPAYVASKTRLTDLSPLIEQHYEPWARFGTIEVWRRKPTR